MSSTLALVQKEQPKEPQETELQYLDRVRADAYWKLYAKEKRTKEEEKEFKVLEAKLLGHALINSSQLITSLADEHFRNGVDRIYDELVAQFGDGRYPVSWTHSRLVPPQDYGYIPPHRSRDQGANSQTHQR